MGSTTDLVHATENVVYTPNAHRLPIWLASTNVFDTVTELEEKFAKGDAVYRRLANGNPSLVELQDALAKHYKAAKALVTCSGMSSIFTGLFQLIRPTENPDGTLTRNEILISDVLYGCTEALLKEELQLWVTARPIKIRHVEDVLTAKTPRTKFVYLELKANPTLAGPPREHLSEFFTRIREAGMETIVDTTFDPGHFSAIALGAYLDVKSLTKDEGGHGDAVGGAILASQRAVDNGDYARICTTYNYAGTAGSPFDAFLIKRGVETLLLRVARQNKNAKELAKYLRAHPKVKEVYSRRERESILLYFELNGGDKETVDFMNFMGKHTFVKESVSLGMTPTIMCRPWYTTHLHSSAESKCRAGIRPNGIRVAFGIEETDDIVLAFDQGLNHLPEWMAWNEKGFRKAFERLAWRASVRHGTTLEEGRRIVEEIGVEAMRRFQEDDGK